MLYKKAQWLFPLAVTLHNAEEAFTMPDFLSVRANVLPVHPSSSKIWAGLLMLTITAWGTTWLAARRGKQSLWAYLTFGGAAAMLLNVFVPHIPATLIFHGYTPGAVTAVLINLPIMSLLVVQALREQWVSGRRAFTYALVVPLVLTLFIVLLFVGS